jgi:hypothetical protein
LPSTPRKEDKPIRPPSRTADSVSRGAGPAEETPPPKLSAEWLATMLLDVTSHLMSAIDRAARLRDPLERMADVAEAEEERRAAATRLRRRRIAVAVIAIVAIVAIVIPLARYLHVWSGRDEVASYETAAGAHRFVLGGASYEVTRAQFEEHLSKIDPEPIRKYWVAIGGRRFPVKQAVGVGLGAERATFSSGQALSILRKLGYQTQDSPP